jgi:hypothetical protein
MASEPDSVRRYQVAISFAGEDRLIAQQIAENLTQRGIEIFYDGYEEASLWGNNLYDYLTDLYNNQADYCVVLVSRHYTTKIWTRVERQAAQARQLLDHDYILPILIDDATPLGMLATTAYIDLRKTSVDAVCETIAVKLSQSSRRDNALEIGDSRGSTSLEASPPAALQHYIGGIYENLGYVVEYDQRAGDLSFNIVARRDVPGVGLEKFAVICDSTGPNGRFDTNLLARYLPLIEAAQDLRVADRCVIVSNGEFTQTARAVSSAAEVLDLTSLKSLEQRLLDVVSPLQRYVHDYEASNIFTSYVPTSGMLSSLFANVSEDKVEDLCAEIQAVFDRDSASFVSILGDFGGGKTTLLDRLKYEYAMKYLRDKSGLIPVFFQLKDSHRYPELDVLVSRTLQREFEREIPVSLFWDRVEGGSFLILLDGFDEMVPNSDRKTRADQFNHLARMFNSKSKVVLTCRPSYFVTHDEYLESLQRIAKGYKAIQPTRPLKRSQTYGEKLQAIASLRQRLSERFLPAQPEATNYSRAITAEVLPFSPQKIDSFLQAHAAKILSCTGGRHTARSLREFLERIYDLKDLMCRPILLDMILETVLDGQIDLDDPDISIGPATLYELYTDMQFDRDWQKGETRQQVLTKEERREFAESLALTMFDQGSLAVDYEQITDLVRQRLDRSGEILTRLESASDEAIATDIQICSFLSRGSDGLFRFVHKSFMEYFVARYLRNVLSSERVDPRWARRLPHEILYFLAAYGYVDAKFVQDLEGIHRKLAGVATDMATEYRMNISALTIATSQQRRSVHLSRGVLDAVQIDRLRLRRAELDSWSLIDSRLTHLELQSSKLLDWSVQRSEFVDWRLNDVEVQMTLRKSEISALFAQGSAINLSGEKSTLRDVELRDVRLSLEGDVELVGASISGGAFDVKNQTATTAALTLENVKVILGAGSTLSSVAGTECSIILQGSCSIAETTVARSAVIADLSAPIELQLHSSVFEECLLSVPPGSKILMGPNSHVRFENSTILGPSVGADEALQLNRLTNCSGYVVDTTEPNPSGKPLAWVSAGPDNASKMYVFPAAALNGGEVFRLDLAACAGRNEVRDKWLKAARTRMEAKARMLLESCIGEKVKSRLAKHISRLINLENQSSKISELAKTVPGMQYLDHATLRLLDGVRPELVISVAEFRSRLLGFMGNSRTMIYNDALAKVWTPGGEPIKEPGEPKKESKIPSLEDLGIPREILDRLYSEKKKQRLTLSQAQNLIERLLGDKAVDKLCESVQRRASDGKKAVINKPFIALLHESQNLFGVARDELVASLEAGVANRVEEILSRRTGAEIVDLVTGVLLQRFDKVFYKVKAKERRTFRYDSELEREMSDLGLGNAVVRKLDALDLALHCSRAELIRLKKEIEGSDLGIDAVLEASRRSLWDDFAEFMKERLGEDVVNPLPIKSLLSGIGSSGELGVRPAKGIVRRTRPSRGLT